jgi:hypothetical protein
MEFRIVALGRLLNILMYHLVIFFFLEGKHEGVDLSDQLVSCFDFSPELSIVTGYVLDNRGFEV